MGVVFVASKSKFYEWTNAVCIVMKLFIIDILSNCLLFILSNKKYPKFDNYVIFVKFTFLTVFQFSIKISHNF